MTLTGFEQFLVYKLKNTTAVSTLVSTRVHPLRLPDTAVFPAVVYQEISAPIISTHDETASGALTSPRYQIDCFAVTYAGSVALGAAVFAALHGFKGVITSGTDTFNVMSCLRTDKRINTDPETGLWWCSMDFIFWYQEG